MKNCSENKHISIREEPNSRIYLKNKIARSRTHTKNISVFFRTEGKHYKAILTDLRAQVFCASWTLSYTHLKCISPLYLHAYCIKKEYYS